MFAAGDYQHIIVIQSLQEGWDDPLCHRAYVDRSMESTVVIEPVIGRLLRQPHATHYPAERLNTAHHYIRVVRNKVFQEVLDEVSAKIGDEAASCAHHHVAAGWCRPTTSPPATPSGSTAASASGPATAPRAGCGPPPGAPGPRRGSGPRRPRTARPDRPRDVRGPRRGRAAVLVDGRRVAVVDTNAATRRDRVVAWVGDVAAGSVVTVRNRGTRGHPCIDLDALVL